MLVGMYRERASRLPGVVLWTNTPGGPTSPVLPDGCTDLMFSGTGLLVAGPDTMPYEGQHGNGTFVGLRMPSGAGPAVWGVPGNEIVNRRVDLADIWPRGEVERLLERVATSADPAVELERIAAAKWRRTPPDPAMMDIATRLGVGVSVSEVASRVAFSERQLHRRALFAYGYGAKTLGRILRLNSALDQARSGLSFAVVASDSGYADQAHFAREVRNFTGRTLTQLLAER